MANYADEVLESIRALMRNSGVVLPPPGAARAAGNVAIDPAIAARAARQAAPDFSNVQGIPDAVLPFTDPSVAARLDGAIAPAAPDMDLGSPLWDQMNKSAGAFDNTLRGRTANLRNQPFAKPAQAAIKDANENAARMRAAMAASAERGEVMQDVGAIGAGAAAAGALGAGALALTSQGLSPDEPSAPAAEATTADLAAESRPVPAVAATDADGIPTDEAAFTEMFKRQYQAREDKRQQRGAGGYADPSDKAKAILEDLNARRRKAGREVPEAAQMMADANRLIAMGNEQRNAPGYTPRKASDPREQAQILLQKLNADRMEAGGEVPHSQQVMAEVRRLQAMGDQQRWPSR